MRRLGLWSCLCWLGKARSRRNQTTHSLFIRIKWILNKNKAIKGDCLVQWRLNWRSDETYGLVILSLLIGKARSRSNQKTHCLFIRIEWILKEYKAIIRDCIVQWRLNWRSDETFGFVFLSLVNRKSKVKKKSNNSLAVYSNWMNFEWIQSNYNGLFSSMTI